MIGIKIRYAVLGLAFLGSAAWAAKPAATSQKTEARPIATVQSARGLVVNGVPTPAGVNSALVAPGDVIGTLDGPATMRYADGQTVILTPSTSFRVPSHPGGSFVATPNPVQLRPMLLPPLSVGKP